MKIKLPTDIDPTGGIMRPDQAQAPQPQPMPTLADFGVPTKPAATRREAAQQPASNNVARQSKKGK